MHKKIILFCLLSLIGLKLSTLRCQIVLNSGGSSIANSNGFFEYNIGEVLSETIKSGDIILTQGLLQKSLEVKTLSIQPMSFEIRTDIYPNPTVDELNIDIITDAHVLIEFLMIDVLGKVVNNFEVKSPSGKLNQKINMTPLTAGNYIMNIIITKKDGNSNRSVYKIVKN